MGWASSQFYLLHSAHLKIQHFLTLKSYKEFEQRLQPNARFQFCCHFILFLQKLFFICWPSATLFLTFIQLTLDFGSSAASPSISEAIHRAQTKKEEMSQNLALFSLTLSNTYGFTQLPHPWGFQSDGGALNSLCRCCSSRNFKYSSNYLRLLICHHITALPTDMMSCTQKWAA